MKHSAISLAQAESVFAVTCTNKLYNKGAGKTKHFSIVEIYAVVAKLLASPPPRSFSKGRESTTQRALTNRDLKAELAFRSFY